MCKSCSDPLKVWPKNTRVWCKFAALGLRKTPHRGGTAGKKSIFPKNVEFLGGTRLLDTFFWSPDANV